MNRKLTFSFSYLTYLLILTLMFISVSYSQIENTLPFSTNSFLSLVTIMISIIALSIRYSVFETRFVSFLFWIFNYIFFGLTPYMLSIDPSPLYLLRSTPTRSLDLAYIVIFLASAITFLAQFVLRPTGNKIQDYDNKQVKILLSQKKLNYLILIYLVSLFPLVQYLGGFGNFFFVDKLGYMKYQSDEYLYVVAENLILVPSLLITISLIVLRYSGTVGALGRWIWFFLPWTLVLANPLIQPRQQTLFLVLPIFFLYFLYSGKSIHSLEIAFPFLLLLSPFLNISIKSLKLSIQEFPILSRLGDFDAFIQLANGITWSKSEYFPVLKQISGSIFFFIPRSLWENKPRDTGVVVAQLEGLRFTNLSAPWMAEAFVNARWLGIFVVAFMIGRGLARASISSIFDHKSSMQLAIVAGSIFILLRGSLLQATGRIFLALILTSLICNSGRKKMKIKEAIVLEKTNVL